MWPRWIRVSTHRLGSQIRPLFRACSTTRRPWSRPRKSRRLSCESTTVTWLRGRKQMERPDGGLRWKIRRLSTSRFHDNQLNNQWDISVWTNRGGVDRLTDHPQRRAASVADKMNAAWYNGSIVKKSLSWRGSCASGKKKKHKYAHIAVYMECICVMARRKNAYLYKMQMMNVLKLLLSSSSLLEKLLSSYRRWRSSSLSISPMILVICHFRNTQPKVTNVMNTSGHLFNPYSATSCLWKCYRPKMISPLHEQCDRSE